MSSNKQVNLYSLEDEICKGTQDICLEDDIISVDSGNSKMLIFEESIALSLSGFDISILKRIFLTFVSSIILV